MIFEVFSFYCIWKKDGKHGDVWVWYCLYNQFVCFVLDKATMTNNLLKSFKEKMQNHTREDARTNMCVEIIQGQ